jgi:regulatory protein
MITKQGGGNRTAFEAAALRYLARRDRTEAQVVAFLVRHGASEAQSRGVTRRLRSDGYLDDQAFARRWAEVRISRHPMGRERLEGELQAQGVTASVAARILDEVYRSRSERSLAETLIKMKSGQARSMAHQARLLRSHGFSEETIEEVVGL